MRPIRRRPLPPDAAAFLVERAWRTDRTRRDGPFDATAEWGRARQRPQMVAVLDSLKTMAGRRERCMYCEDSHGSDIEHFRPKVSYPERMFTWENLLLCCAECGRFKGVQFPLDEAGRPLLVDPTLDDPWEHIDFEPETANLTARYLRDADAYSSKGEATVEVLHLDRREALSEGYKKTYSRLARIVREWLAAPAPAPNLPKRLIDADDHGLLGWFFWGNGQETPPFRDLRAGKPRVWEACRHHLRQA